jgi:hypothetical protein
MPLATPVGREPALTSAACQLTTAAARLVSPSGPVWRERTVTI